MPIEGKLVVHPDGHRVHYEVHGDGDEVLVALHGGPGMDRRYMLGLSELAGPDWKVVFFDQLGGGQSDRPKDDSLWTIDRYAEEVDAVCTGLGFETFHLLGHSFGGMLAAQYALVHQERLKTLILSHCLCSGGEIVQSCEASRAWLDASDYALMQRHESRGTLDDPEYMALWLRVTAAGFRRSTPYDPETSLKELVDDVLPLFPEDQTDSARIMWGDNEFHVTGNLLDWDIRDRLSEILCPTLVLGSWYDPMSSAFLRPMADLIPQAELLIFGKSGHMILQERERDAYLGVVADFLRRHS
jgi:proline iminopeptidase